MTETIVSPSVAVIFDSQPMPKPPKPSLWDWIKYYAWNLYRKPMVWRRQKELLKIYTDVKSALERDVLPQLWHRRLVCNACRDQYLALKPQIFLSQLELILKRMACEIDDHATVSRTFLSTNDFYFRRSEDIAAWINGFKR